jgi:hypothetical protein
MELGDARLILTAMADQTNTALGMVHAAWPARHGVLSF